MNVFSVFQHLQKDKQRKQRHLLKLGKKRRESSKRNYYIISPRVIIKAIIITVNNTHTHTHTHTRTHTHTHTHIHTYTHTQDDDLSRASTHSPSLSPSISLPHTHTNLHALYCSRMYILSQGKSWAITRGDNCGHRELRVEKGHTSVHG